MALAVLLFLSGCASSKGPPDPAKIQAEMVATLATEKELIRSEVGDPDRAERLLVLLDERDRLVAEHAQIVRRFSAEMASLNVDYNADRESFNQLV